ncbi:MAG: DNA mismatch repair protein MutS [Bacteroidales bacterium]|nr:DNA mismatch repair protein MutS [Bacteroidales bacterium]
MSKQPVNTPLMKQYFAIKAEHPDALLLFRVGDFYETFGEDAIKASKALGIVLTKRANGAAASVELAGFPHHAMDTYLPKLVRAGFKVAVCEQLEDPKLAKKLVKRGITEVVTPGLSYNPELLEAREHNFLASIHIEGPGAEEAGIAFTDISTGTVQIAQGNLTYIDSLLAQYAPKEILLCRGMENHWKSRTENSVFFSTIDPWAFVPQAAEEKVKTHFGVESLKGFGAEQLPLALSAVGAMLFYLETNKYASYEHLCTLQRIDPQHLMWLDKYSIRNLELFPRLENHQQGASLIEVIDKTQSPMGARLLRQWLVMPLQDKAALEKRQDAVSVLREQKKEANTLRKLLAQTGDMERLISRASAGRINPREVVQLGYGLEQAHKIKTLLAQWPRAKVVQEEVAGMDGCDPLVTTIRRTLVEAPPAQVGKGQIVAGGFDPQLDELRYIVSHNKEYLQEMQHKKAQETGITSLKIGFNNVFGYYIEVRNTHKDKVPSSWIRKQTLVSAERYITEELKEYEEKILGAEERIALLEQEIFNELITEIHSYVRPIQKNARILAGLDCLAGFALLAEENKYVRPKLEETDVIDIRGGRHPVLETIMPPGEKYVPNSVYLDNSTQQIIILTGPNMAGKSALLRQTGLIVLLAQIGSCVPAEEATLGLVDKLFTRVGASDNIARRESTFMVEMLESAAILNNITDKSLVLFDEIGRGTSTYDGISIAWAIVEYMHEKAGARAKTLFATHYHELNQMAEQYVRVKNFHIAVKERGQKVLFLHKMITGGVQHSFGIHVAGMAGMPRRVILTAQEILKNMEAKKEQPPSLERPKQLSFFQLEDPLLQALKRDIESLDLNGLTPLEAFDALRELKRKIGQKE